ncbi:MAG: hypothetical protein ABIF10_04375 [Candidatus Woesearchaeota archaeon]
MPQKTQKDFFNHVDDLIGQQPAAGGSGNRFSGGPHAVVLRDLSGTIQSERYTRFEEQLKILQGGLKEFMDQYLTKKGIEDVPRKEVVMVPERSIGNFFRKLMGYQLRDMEIEQTFIDKKEKLVPITDGTAKDLQRIIKESTSVLRQMSKETGTTVKEIDSVTNGMRSLQNEYLNILVREKKDYENKNGYLATCKEAISHLREHISSMKVLDDGFAKNMNRFDRLEDTIDRTRYEIQSHNVSTWMATNQRHGLRMYEKILDMAKYSAQNMMNYTENFCDMTDHLNVCVDHVHQVCEYLARAYDIGHRTVLYLQAGSKYLSGMAGLVKEQATSPATTIVDPQPFFDQLNRHRAEFEQKLEGYKQEQENLDDGVKKFALASKAE